MLSRAHHPHAQGLLALLVFNPLNRWRYRHIPGVQASMYSLPDNAVGACWCSPVPVPVVTVLYVVVVVAAVLLLLLLVGPRFQPVLGNLRAIRQYGAHEFTAACRDAYGPVFKIWLGHLPTVVVADPELGRCVSCQLMMLMMIMIMNRKLLW
jgi:Cytochrome P450